MGSTVPWISGFLVHPLLSTADPTRPCFQACPHSPASCRHAPSAQPVTGCMEVAASNFQLPDLLPQSGRAGLCATSTNASWQGRPDGNPPVWAQVTGTRPSRAGKLQIAFHLLNNHLPGAGCLGRLSDHPATPVVAGKGSPHT